MACFQRGMSLIAPFQLWGPVDIVETCGSCDSRGKPEPYWRPLEFGDGVGFVCHGLSCTSTAAVGNASPEILEGFKSLNNTINSLVAQVASMRSSMDKMEKQLAGKSIPTISTTQTQGPTRHTPQRTITPRPQTPRPSTPIPTQQAQGPPPPPPANLNSKPKGAPGRPELYEDQAANAFIADLTGSKLVPRKSYQSSQQPNPFMGQST